MNIVNKLIEHKKLVVFVMVFLTFSSNITIALGTTSYSLSTNLAFQKEIYLGFAQNISLREPAHLGVTNDSSLVGYWNFDEGSGNLAIDSSSNNNTCLVNGALYSNGKFGKALSFNSTNHDYVESIYGNLSTNYLTITFWIQSNTTNQNWGGPIVRNSLSNSIPSFEMYFSPNKQTINFDAENSENVSFLVASTINVLDGRWHQIVGVVDTNYISLFVDGAFNNRSPFSGNLQKQNNQNVTIGRSTSNFFSGLVDDVRIYNRSVSQNEIASLYEQSDPLSYENYYFVNSINNCAVVINAQRVDEDDKSILINCTNFFTNNNLEFQANSSAVINVWTNLGKPINTNGIWNSNNHTTTLMLDASSGEIDWNIGCLPSASSLSITSKVQGKNSAFSAFWTDNRSLSGGGFLFSTNNSGQWTNASWIPFNSNSGWGNTTLTLSSIAGQIVGFREYANDSLNVWGDSGIYFITTSVDSNVSYSSPSPTTASSTSAPATSTPIPTTTINPTSTPTSKLAQVSSLPTVTILVVSSAVGVLISVAVLTFKKGYVTVEVLEEDSLKETSEDYAI